MTEQPFWVEMARLVANSHIIIDRPRGTAHPRHPDMIYPFDYGYLEGTYASEGSGIDLFIGSQSDRALTGILCTFDTIKRDMEIKFLLGCAESDVQSIRSFLGDMKTLFIPNPKEEKE